MNFFKSLLSIVAAPVTGGASLLGLAGSVGAGLIEDYKEGRKNKREVKAAITKNKIKLATAKTTHNNEWEMAQLEGKDDLLRRFSFFMLSMPFVVAMFAPERVKDYFDVAIAAIPEWYQYAYMLVLSAVWGISEFKKWRS